MDKQIPTINVNLNETAGRAVIAIAVSVVLLSLFRLIRFIGGEHEKA
jgi:hypothetical protein